METVRTIINSVKDSYWIGNRTDTVYGISATDEALYTNTMLPRRLTYRIYNSGRYAIADSYYYNGGISLDGKLVILENTIGTLEGNTIRWSNGDVWNRVSDIPQPRMNGVELQNAMDERESTFLNERMRATYPYFTQFNGM